MAELWYFTRDGQAQDPVTKEELAQLAGCGLLRPTDLVWTEGMPQWVRASSTGGLFAEDSLTGPNRRPRDRSDVYDLEPEEPVTRRRQDEDEHYRSHDNEDDDFDQPDRRKRSLVRGAKAAIGAGAVVGVGGMSPGAKAAVVGGSLLTLLLIVGIILLIVLGGRGNTRSFSLAEKQSENFKLPFQAGNKVEIWVKSTGNSDVDLYVYDANNRLVEFDDGPSSDCYVKFLAGKNQTFRVEVRNEARGDEVWRNGPNSGTLTFQEGPLLPGEIPPVEYTNRQPWFMNQANRPIFNNPGLGRPINQPPRIKGPNFQPPPFNRPNRPFNPGFPNDPNRRP